MPQFRFRFGLHVKLGGDEYVLDSRLEDNSWVLHNLGKNEDITCTTEELLLKYGNHELVALIDEDDHYPVTKRLEEKLYRDLNNFPDHLIELALKMLPYVQAIDKQNIPLDPHNLAEMIVRVASERGDIAPPSPSQVYRNYRRWRACGRDVRALIPCFSSRGRKRLSSNTGVARILSESIHDLYMIREPETVADVQLEVFRRISQENRYRAKDKQLSVPSLSTVFREIARIPKYEVAMAQKGKRAANIEFRTTGKGPEITRRLQVCEVDHTPSDLMVVDDNTFLPLGRATVSSILDKYTRSALSMLPEFSPESSTTVARCLRHAILPKTYLATDYPEVKTKWECYGVPEILLWDNALHFHSKHLERAALQIGCDIQYGRKDCPWYRAQIEEFLGKVNHNLLHKLPGTTFSNILERGDYDPAKNAIVTRSTFNKILHIWIVDIYMQSPNRGMEDIPAVKWRESAPVLEPPLPLSAAELQTALGEVEIRTAFHYGIGKFSLKYNCKRLGELRRMHGSTIDVEINFDRSDIGQLYVLDPDSGEYFRVPALNYEYAHGLTLWQHRVIRRFTIEQLRLKTDKLGLAEAKAKIRELVKQDLMMNPNKTHKAAARFLECLMPEQTLSPRQNTASTPGYSKSVSVPPEFEDIPSEKLSVFKTKLKPVHGLD